MGRTSCLQKRRGSIVADRSIFKLVTRGTITSDARAILAFFSEQFISRPLLRNRSAKQANDPGQRSIAERSLLILESRLACDTGALATARPKQCEHRRIGVVDFSQNSRCRRCIKRGIVFVLLEDGLQSMQKILLLKKQDVVGVELVKRCTPD